MPRSLAIVYNPASGLGRAGTVAASLRAALQTDGHSAVLVESSRGGTDDPRLSAVEGVVVIGGDGTLMGLLPALQRTGRPFVLVPGGNESLAARYCGMSADPAEIRARIERWQPVAHRVGVASGRLFFTMVSCGFDADVVARIAAGRRGPIGHRGYLRPTLLAVFGYRAPCITLTVDGVPAVSGEAGYVIVANNPTYARKLDPVPEASTASDTLAARFIPRAGIGFALRGVFRALIGGPINTSGSRLFRGTAFEISTDLPRAVQSDGELLGETPVTITRSVEPVWSLG